ncbi:MAG: alpha/beta hydrolase-fold protein [Bacteroidia bacterium]
MKSILLSCLLSGLILTSFAQSRIEGPFSLQSEVYPETVRDYWLYIPAQYDPAKAACVMVVQDGLGRAEGWRLPQVMDSLIALGKVPVTIGIFVDHGKVLATDSTAFPRYNRSFEYDAMGDRYSRFLLDELLPAVSLNYRLSEDPNDRSIAGASSGGICAFNVAWERPDQFSRVLSTIGTYVGLRGGDEFPTLVRKSEPRPIRVFLEDGSNDLNIYAGDWWMANQDMLSALEWAGYENHHIWGDQGHNSQGARKILPEALVWLWEDYPQRPATHLDQYQGLDLLIEGEEWVPLFAERQNIDQLTVDAGGTVFFSNLADSAIYYIDKKGEAILFQKLGFQPAGISFGPDGRLFVANPAGKLVMAFAEANQATLVMQGQVVNKLMTSPKGLYFTQPNTAGIGLLSPDANTIYQTSTGAVPTALALSAEGSFLNVGLSGQVFGYSFRLSERGELAAGQAYIHYHIPYSQATAAPSAICVDQNNFSYSATNMGIQVADQLGRIQYIMQSPTPSNQALAFGGAALDQLYLVSEGKLYRRKVNRKGAQTWFKASKPPKPRM